MIYSSLYETYILTKRTCTLQVSLIPAEENFSLRLMKAVDVMQSSL